MFHSLKKKKKSQFGFDFLKVYLDCSCSLLLLFSKADDIVTSDRWLHRMWAPSESNGQLMSHRRQEQELPTVADDCNTKTVYIFIYNKKNSEPHFYFLKVVFCI